MTRRPATTKRRRTRTPRQHRSSHSWPPGKNRYCIPCIVYQRSTEAWFGLSFCLSIRQKLRPKRLHLKFPVLGLSRSFCQTAEASVWTEASANNRSKRSTRNCTVSRLLAELVAVTKPALSAQKRSLLSSRIRSLLAKLVSLTNFVNQEFILFRAEKTTGTCFSEF